MKLKNVAAFSFWTLCIISLKTCLASQNATGTNAIIESFEDVRLLSRLLIRRLSLSDNVTLNYDNDTTLYDHANLTNQLGRLLQDARFSKISNSPKFHETCNVNCSHQETENSKFNKIYEASLQCLRVEELVNLLSSGTHSLDEAVSLLCPMLLFQQNEECQSNIRMKDESGKLKPSRGAVWGYGILFVTIISCCSLVGVSLLPALNNNIYDKLLMLFEGLAVGSLTGSAVFHLIPQAFNLLGQDGEHGYLWKSLLIFGGIYLFYISEILMKIIFNSRKKNNMKGSIKEYGSQAIAMNENILNDSNEKVPHGINGQSISLADPTKVPAFLINGNSSNEDGQAKKHNHEHEVHFEKGKDSPIATVAWMIIFGDGLHNFIDGLSIGAAFSESILAGISISVAVICEEFPHELGDFAILLSAGMTMRQALMYNFLSACTCYLGLVFGILVGDLAEGSLYIFALAGGMFLYIALVDMMAELREALEAAQSQGLKKTFQVLFIQQVGIILGLMVLFIMAKYSEYINFDSSPANAGDQMMQTARMALNSDHYTMESLDVTQHL